MMIFKTITNYYNKIVYLIWVILALIWLLCSVNCISLKNENSSRQGSRPDLSSNTNLSGSISSEVNADIHPEELVMGCSLDDVVGEHNPRMIGIWGGKLTQEVWFIRNARSGKRIQSIAISFEYFEALHGRLPSDMEEFIESKFFAIQPLDPITGNLFNYTTVPSNIEDYLNLCLAPSGDTWMLVWAIRPGFAKNEPQINERDLRDLIGTEGNQKELFDEYPNLIALRGALLSELLNYILYDFQIRRNQMPETPEAFLDGLYQVSESWAENDPQWQLDLPCGFLFGIDKSLELAIGIWQDEFGQYFYYAVDYSPWPEGGWIEVPSWNDLILRPQNAFHTFNRSNYLVESGNITPDFVPEIILWQSNLMNEW